jgi:catechol 2,3-dioxygenase-like lactoylglutathione lyase family enzyme
VKTHLNLATTNLARSAAFYATLLDASPTKLRDDYALFVSEDPGLELALDVRDSVAPAQDAHYGICVEDIADVERAIARLERAGLVSSIEREETCCYANQTKVWASDPDGRRWEIYTVLEETEHRNDSATTCCSAPNESRSCCAA